MKYLMWLLNAALFFVLFAFALNNQDMVTLHLFFGARWQAPMVVVVLLSMLIGVFLGVVAMVPLWLRAKKARRRQQPNHRLRRRHHLAAFRPDRTTPWTLT